MCAPRGLSMEPQSISRFSSTSTSRTLVENEAHLAAPLSPTSIIDSKLEAASPIVQTGDKQWIDLDYVSPKLLRELRRQYDDSGSQDKGALAKSAAKIKAYVQQTKTGFDLRLRRKFSTGPDQITDVHLVRDTSEKKKDESLVQPESEGILISELPDTPLVSELSAHDVPRVDVNQPRTTAEEPLPRYEPSPTAPRAESLPRAIYQLDALEVGPADARSSHPSDGDFSLTTSFSNPDMQSRSTNELRKLLESLIRDLPNLDKIPDPINVKDSEDAGNGKQEENTDAGLSRSSHREARPIIARSTRASQRGKQRFLNTTHTSAATLRVSPTNPYTDKAKVHPRILVRRLTRPKRLPSTAGLQSVRSALLKDQCKILGVEHPLCIEAKRASTSTGRDLNHDSALQLLNVLLQSERLAVDTLGNAHPLVAAFSANLGALQSAAAETESTLRERRVGGSGDAEPAATPVHPSCVEHKVERKEDLSHAAAVDEAREHPKQAQEAKSRDTAPPTLILTPAQLPAIQTDLPASAPTNSPTTQTSQDALWNSRQAPHQPRPGVFTLASMTLSAVSQAAKNGIEWLEHNYGQELPVQPGHARVRWTCSCGERLYDDFRERRFGAARELEAYLNRPRTRTGGGTPITPSSSSGNRSFNSSVGATPSTNTSWSSYGHSSQRSLDHPSKSLQTTASFPGYSPFAPVAEPPWLLTCANEERFAPKVAHLDMSPFKITSDKDLAKALRDHYFDINRKWWKRLRLRGLTTIEFVQFECHQNRFADLRRVPDVPPIGRDDYTFEPAELMPPVGSRYLLHLFKHPEDYDGELITYLRAPKKQNGRLQLGVGWGINLVEGFLAERIWMLVNVLFGFISLIFGIAWACKKNDIQGAFGVAQWICALAIFAGGWLQACLG